ncbi:type IV pilus assembly protein PilW [Comamonas odontotermitis]|uniref:Type IV pilus assembly protein PilW n=1 Tax=Comamonas odontotermitis TaxID=379895 RepID=A0ABR6RLQ1_9BURK|nr:PilW family protein [Comamonas odontotermitis]MBB6580084.1 type IV pilus assembly protein PilW [Comamonas odontotermitis]
MSKIEAIIDRHKAHINQRSQKGLGQRGVSLIELMVGIAIGLLVIAVAGGALMVSRGISGTVSDANTIQQQAAFAFRTIGLQLRQAGSLYLNLNPKSNTNTAIDLYAVPVAFETKAISSDADRSFTPKVDTVSGSDNALNLGYRRYKETVYPEKSSDPATQSLSRDCLGGPEDKDTADNNSYMRLESRFALDGTDLRCTGTSGTSQVIVNNVANFRIRYLLQDSASTGSPKIRYVDATGVGANWGRVTGVEVCLVLFGNERMSLPESNYTDCDGATKVDMSRATSTDMNGNALGTARAGRIHMTFRNVYQIRSQGLVGSVL